MEEKKYLRRLGVFPVTIKEVKKSEYKGQESAVFVLEHEDGSLIDLKFKLPLTAQHKFVQGQFQNLLKVCGVTKPTECKGKQIAAYVAPSEWKGKMFWNVKDVFDVKWMDDHGSPDAGLDDFGMGGSSGGTDEIPF